MIKYTVVDKHTKKTIAEGFKTKAEAKHHRDAFQAGTKKGLPSQPTQDDPKDHRSNSSNWQFKVCKIKE
jgi:hypothetical protein